MIPTHLGGLVIRSRLRLPGVLTRLFRSRGALYLPEYSHEVDPRQNVLGILRSIAGPSAGLARIIPASNIVTDAGDVYFAQRSAGEAPTNAFGIFEMYSAGTPGKAANRSAFTAIASSQIAMDATYPKTNDADADNTGAGTKVRTARSSYSAASFSHAAITHGGITNATPGASEPMLAGWAWAASINKTSGDTLKVIHNGASLGV